MEQQGRKERSRGPGGRAKRGRGRAQRQQEVPRPGQQSQPPPQGPPPPGARGPPPPASQWPPPPGAQGPPPSGAQGPPPPGAQGPPPPGSQWPPPPGAQGLPPSGPQEPPPTEAQESPPAEAARSGSGRTVRRGTSRDQGIRPGDQQVAEVAKGVQEMGIEEGAVGGAPAAAGAPAAPERRSRYADITFRTAEQPKRGTSGKVVALRGNFFKLRAQDDWRVYQYHVDYMPPCESSKMRKGLLYSHDTLLGPVKAFDGMILYLPFRMQNDETVVHSYTRNENQQIKITIKLTCELVNVNPSTIQLMNILWRKFLAMMNMKQINRHYFDMERRIEVPKHGLEVIPGFQTSVLRYETDLLLDMDITHKVMRTSTVLDHMYELQSQFGGSNQAFFNQASKDIVGTVVLTRYNNKTYTVDDISWDGQISDTFLKNNNPTTYKDYYQRHYDITIKDDLQPLLVTRAKRRDLRRGEAPNIYLVPELCIITGLTEANRADFMLKKDLATHTRVNPDTRVNRLTSFMRDVKRNPAVVNELRGWGLDLEDNLVTIQARQLNPEQLFMLERGKEVPLVFKQEEADWSRDMRGKIMKYAPTLKNWLLLFPRRCAQNARDLSDSLRRVGPPMGMNIDAPIPKELESDRNDTYLRELRHGVVVNQTQIVVCILPNNKKDRYDAIKKFCCCDQPVPSQMVLDKTLSRKDRLMSVATKIAIQMNCKMGGVVWSTPIPLKRLMIIGFDTYHDSSKKGRSVGGVVATINPEYTRYYSTTTFQMTHVELLNQLTSCVTSCMGAFYNVNGYPPERVIVFRDGVGDGQLNLVFEHEIPQIKAAIGDAKLGFVVVKKRTIARFFLEGGDQGGGRGDPRGRGGGGGGGRRGFTNPGPGTVIDDVATKPTWLDFFLISQSVREGTVTPTHYNVLLNEQNLQAEHYQRMAYKLTHMYYNWQGTIRVPAPCMYAHKLAFLVGQSLHLAPKAVLADKLYFL